MSVYRFGEVELDTANLRLNVRGEVRQIEPKSFRLLQFLIENRERVAGKAEIFRVVWEETAVTDNALTRAVTQIRRALDDDPKEPRYIETVPTVGYRFIGELKEELDLPLAAVSEPSKWNLGKAGWLAAGAALVLVSVAAGRHIFLSRDNAPTDAESRAVPLTSFPGQQGEPSFSPDGSHVAFTWNGPRRENWDIYIKVVGEGEPVRLTTDPARDFAPSWSPDGRWIAFGRGIPGGRYALMVISSLGGAERKVREFRKPFVYDPMLAWSRDSKNVFAPGDDEVSHQRGIFAVALDSGELHRVTAVEAADQNDEGLSLSPDGQTLAFTRFPNNVFGELYTLPLASDLSPAGTPRLLVSDASGPGIAWSADGKELIYMTGQTAASNVLKRVAVSGSSAPQPVPQAGDGVSGPAVSRVLQNGKSYLTWVRRTSDANIYRLKVNGAGTAGEPEAVIDSVFRDVFPQYSPDGKSILFYSQRSGNNEIWLCLADGTKCRQITSLAARVTGGSRWSPDGKQIVFDSNQGGIYELYVMSAEGGLPRRITNSPSANFAANWSPDGRWLYFTSNRAGGLSIWKMPASGGAAEQVLKSEGVGVVVSPDGKFLYYVREIDREHAALWRMPTGGGSEEQVLPQLFRSSYAVTGRGIYYSSPDASAAGGTIEFLDFATGKRSVLARTGKALELGLAVSPDERYLLYPQVDYQGSTLMMLDNFR